MSDSVAPCNSGQGDPSRLDNIFPLWNSPYVAWEVEYTEVFGDWWNSLSEPEQDTIAAAVDLLEEHGPALKRPYADAIAMSKHANMKELRIQHAGRPYRVLYAFDPRRAALLLIGGDKTGNDRWYQDFVPLADKLFDRHLAQFGG